MLDICKELGVFVISDEIHHDIVFAPAKHIPSATVGAYDANLVTLTAPSKTFNLAACQNSFVIIPDAEIRRRFDDYTSKLCVRSGNPFGYIAAEAAYRHGLPWLEEVLAIIEGTPAPCAKRSPSACRRWRSRPLRAHICSGSIRRLPCARRGKGLHAEKMPPCL